MRGEADGAGEREDYLAAVRIEICGKDERRQRQIHVRVRAPRPRCLDAEPFDLRVFIDGRLGASLAPSARLASNS